MELCFFCLSPSLYYGTAPELKQASGTGRDKQVEADSRSVEKVQDTVKLCWSLTTMRVRNTEMMISKAKRRHDNQNDRDNTSANQHNNRKRSTGDLSKAWSLDHEQADDDKMDFTNPRTPFLGRKVPLHRAYQRLDRGEVRRQQHEVVASHWLGMDLRIRPKPRSSKRRGSAKQPWHREKH